MIVIIGAFMGKYWKSIAGLHIWDNQVTFFLMFYCIT